MSDLLASMPAWLGAALAATFICLGITLWAIWHAYWRDFDNPQEKFYWIMAAMFLPFIGGLAYLIIGRKRGRLNA